MLSPTITVSVSATGKALVNIATNLLQSSSSGGCIMGFAVDAVAASDGQSIGIGGTTGVTFSDGVSLGATYLVTGLTPGSHTFTAKYRRTGGTGTCTFSDRSLVVTPY